MKATTAKIYGLEFETKNGPGARGAEPSMGGFVEWQYSQLRDNETDDYCSVMTAFEPAKLPVLSFLASEYAVLDQYFCSVPGPTWPNRAFALMGTSDGLTETSIWYEGREGMLLPSKTFGEQLEELGFSYRMYYQDSPWEMFIRGILHHPERMAAWDQFHLDAKRGTLPDWSFIWPRLGIDVASGLGAKYEWRVFVWFFFFFFFFGTVKSDYATRLLCVVFVAKLSEAINIPTTTWLLARR